MTTRNKHTHAHWTRMLHSLCVTVANPRNEIFHCLSTDKYLFIVIFIESFPLVLFDKKQKQKRKWKEAANEKRKRNVHDVSDTVTPECETKWKSGKLKANNTSNAIFGIRSIVFIFFIIIFVIESISCVQAHTNNAGTENILYSIVLCETMALFHACNKPFANGK